MPTLLRINKHEIGRVVHASLGGKNNKCLAESLRSAASGTDTVVIGSGLRQGEQLRTATMVDVMAKVDGIRYLIKQWIPFGMVTMIVGPPGVGKSAFALYSLVRPIIVGKVPWFHGLAGPREPGDVLWCDTEGTAAITVQRIIDWKLPPERIKVPFEDDPLRPIDLSRESHVSRIEGLVTAYSIPLVVIDSLRGAHRLDENSSVVCTMVSRLASIAERTNAAIVLVHHTRKTSTGEELTADSSRGSNSLVAMVRSQIGIDRPNPQSPWLRMRMLKENLGLKPEPVGFVIRKTGLEFGTAPGRPLRETKCSEAENWLRDRMIPGQWHPAADLLQEAEGLFSTNAIQRARVGLGIVKPYHVRRTGSIWEWRLPATTGEETKDTLP